MKITNKSKYAILALLDMAHNYKDKPARVWDIARKQELSPYYLDQIFCKLRQVGIIRTIKGPGGGAVFAKPLEKITLLDIFKSVEKFTNYADGMQKPAKNDPKEYKQLHKVITTICEDIEKGILSNTTLADIVSS